MNENIFRIFITLIFVSAITISGYFRRKADQDSGERVSRKVDGKLLFTIIRVAGLFLWFVPIAYVVNPALLAWSKMGMPDMVRWIGVGIGVLVVFGLYWLFSSIGTGITPTSATRKEHKLTTSGPYHYIRHPLYTFGTTFFVSLGLIADSWFISLLGLVTFIVMAARTPMEEANLIEKFGDEYRDYMKRTGRFFPKVGGMV